MADSTSSKPCYIRFEIYDLNGRSMSKIVPARHKDRPVFMYGGSTGAGSSSEVLTFPPDVVEAGFPNTQLIPDWSTYKRLPWASTDTYDVYQVICVQSNLRDLPTTPAPFSSRAVCERMIRELEAWEGLGLSILSAHEMEFTVAKPVEGFRKGEHQGRLDGWQPLFSSTEIFTTLQSTKSMDLMATIEQNMHEVGVDVRTMNPEYGEGQLEITFAPTIGIRGPDQSELFRNGVKEICQSRGLLASFFSKPFGANGPGNGGHLNFSLWMPQPTSHGGCNSSGQVEEAFIPDGYRNAMVNCREEDTISGLSQLAEHFIAGVLAHSRGLEALCSSTKGCYLRHGRWAPDRGDWGEDNRTTCIRVKKGGEASTYCEWRMPSSCANVYLVVAGLIAAGLDGLERKLHLSPPKDQAIGNQPVDTAMLPGNLEDALVALREDRYLVSKLGEPLVRWYEIVKRAEATELTKRMSNGMAEASAWREMYLEYL